MFDRGKPVHAPILFALILISLFWAGFFSVYWLKDNQWSLDPTDLSIRWISDADYQAIRTSTASEYKLAGGGTLVLSPDPVERDRTLSSYQVATPDGRWHGRASASLQTHTSRTWLGVALPVAGISLLGLFLTIPRRGKPVPTKQGREDFAVA